MHLRRWLDFSSARQWQGTINILKDAISAIVDQLVDAGKEQLLKRGCIYKISNFIAFIVNDYWKDAADGLVDFANEMEGLAMVGTDVYCK